MSLVKKRRWGWINKSLPLPKWKHFLLAFTIHWSVFQSWPTNVLFWQISLFSIEADDTQEVFTPNVENLIQDYTMAWLNPKEWQHTKMDYFETQTLLLPAVFCLPSFWVLSLPHFITVFPWHPSPTIYADSYLWFWGYLKYWSPCLRKKISFLSFSMPVCQSDIKINSSIEAKQAYDEFHIFEEWNLLDMTDAHSWKLSPEIKEYTSR